MDKYAAAFGMLKESILGNDIIILFAAILTFVFMLFTLFMKTSIKGRVKEWEKNRNKPFTKFLVHWLSRFYTLFTTTITIFPLLGMLGTVCGLLGLDLAAGDMDNIKNNFFLALTSTAWGIIFSVIFKMFNALISDGVEEQIENAKRLSTVTEE